MSDIRTTELQSLSKLKIAGKLHYWRGTIEIPETELHAICDEIQAEHDQAIVATLGEVDDNECYLVYEGKKYPANLDFGVLGMMPITITVGGFRYLVEVPNGE